MVNGKPALSVVVASCADEADGEALSPALEGAQLASAKANADKSAVVRNEFMRMIMPAKHKSAIPLKDRITIGVDEVGRGPLAGPVVAAAVILCAKPPDGLDDSKRLSAKRRAVLDVEIRQTCHWAIGVAEVEEIDRINIFVATMQAMTRAVTALCSQVGADNVNVLVDGNLTPAGRCEGWCWPAQPIVGGDGIEPAISAASIIAKEYRDRLMRDLAVVHPHYGWDHNAGYGTREHMEALRRHGPTPYHRRSFAPVAQLEIPL